MRGSNGSTEATTDRKLLELPKRLAELKRRRRRGQPVPRELREHALELIAAGVRPKQVARLVSVTTEALRGWCRAAEREGRLERSAAHGSKAPKAEPVEPLGEGSATTPGSGSEPEETEPCAMSVQRATQGLSPVEEAAILELKRRHPSMGPAQIRTQLKRFKGWRLAVRAIAGVLKRHGYELVHIGSRPKGEAEPVRFEAPHRNALWQLDFVELRVGSQRVSLLLILDDFSRFVVGHALLTEPTSQAVVTALSQAIRHHGKPEGVYTDRGGQFLAWGEPSSLGRFLETELIDHHVGTPYSPRGRGKVEALAATVQRELWSVVHFGSVEEAREALARFFEEYNHRRAHMGLDGLTPADRFFGRWEQVQARLQSLARQRATGHVLQAEAASGPSEDWPATAEPVEVLRLVVTGGRAELRFLGQKLLLGRLRD